MISSGRNQGVLILSAVVSFFIIAEIVISSAGTANPAPEDKAIAITGAWRGVRKKQRDIQPVRHSGQVLCLPADNVCARTKFQRIGEGTQWSAFSSLSTASARASVRPLAGA